LTTNHAQGMHKMWVVRTEDAGLAGLNCGRKILITVSETNPDSTRPTLTFLTLSCLLPTHSLVCGILLLSLTFLRAHIS